MMHGVAIAVAIKGNSYQQAIQSFFTSKGNPQKGHSDIRDKISIWLRPVFLVVR